MTTIGNRQNLTDAEASLAVEVYNAAGRLDSVKTKAANDTIFRSDNVITSAVAGSVVTNVSATTTKIKNARDKILSDNK
jgi:hypothetical protein